MLVLFLFKALDCNLVNELLAYLDSSLIDQEARAFIVKSLKSMQSSFSFGDQVSSILKASPIWAQFDKQKHDLFVKTDTAAGYLTSQAPGVAGYLTTTAAPVPTIPPPMEDPDARINKDDSLI